MLVIRAAICVLAALLTASCAPIVVGGAVGADVVVGSRVHAGPARGAPLTVELAQSQYFADQAGKAFDHEDRGPLVAAMRELLDYGQPGTQNAWMNSANGHWGTLSFVRAYEDGKQAACRDIEETITVAGRTRYAIVTACQNADGPWRIENWSSLSTI